MLINTRLKLIVVSDCVDPTRANIIFYKGTALVKLLPRWLQNECLLLSTYNPGRNRCRVLGTECVGFLQGTKSTQQAV